MRAFAGGLLLGTFLMPCVGLIVFLLGWFPVPASSVPPHWEASLARRAFSASVARQAQRLESPVPPNIGNLRLGLKLYRDNCSGCHGDAGQPSPWGTTALYPRVPQFDSESPRKPDWQMFWIVKRGVRYTGMGAWEGLMSEEDMWKVVSFLSHLENLPPDVEAEWRRHQPGK